MGTPLGSFIRAKRDSLRPEDLGLPSYDRRRAPGLRRSELAARAGISIEYLTRIEQGRDHNPSDSVVRTLSDALSLDAAERHHILYLAKISGSACARHPLAAKPERAVRPEVRQILALLEPGIAVVTNRIGDVLAHTDGFAAIMTDTGLLDSDEPNFTRYVFTDPRSRTTLADWHQVADEQVFNLWLGPSTESFEWFTTELAPEAGTEFTRRLHHHLPPPQVPLAMTHPLAGRLGWNRETLELPTSDAQQLVIWLPADEATAQAADQLRHHSRHHPHLRAA